MSPGRVTTWYLEQTAAGELLRARTPEPAPLLMRAEVPSPSLNRYFYTAVGGDWQWKDRLPWSRERWLAYLDRPQVQTWVLYARGTPAGYIELEQQEGGHVEIAYFGLLPEFLGQGYGGYLLGEGIARAWQMPGTQRVWVHTCSLDHAAALQNYQARGMRIYKVEETGASPAVAGN